MNRVDSSKKSRTAVFLDRDGVINRNIDGDYVRRWQEFEFLPGSRKPPLEEIPEVQTQVAKAEAVLGEAGRILLRYSATQDLARVMIEGDDQEVIEREAQDIAEVIRKTIR